MGTVVLLSSSCRSAFWIASRLDVRSRDKSIRLINSGLTRGRFFAEPTFFGISLLHDKLPRHFLELGSSTPDRFADRIEPGEQQGPCRESVCRSQRVELVNL